MGGLRGSPGIPGARESWGGPHPGDARFGAINGGRGLARAGRRSRCRLPRRDDRPLRQESDVALLRGITLAALLARPLRLWCACGLLSWIVKGECASSSEWWPPSAHYSVIPCTGSRRHALSPTPDTSLLPCGPPPLRPKSHAR